VRAVLVGGSARTLERLEDQLGGLGVSSVTAVPASEAALRAVAAEARAFPAEGLLIGSGDVITHGSVLGALLTDPRFVSGVLSSSDVSPPPGAWSMRSDRGRVLSVGSPHHSVGEPTESFLGFVKVDAGSVDAVAAVADELASLDLHGADPVALLAVGLVRSGVFLGLSFVGRLFWARASSAAELDAAFAALSRYDEDRVLLDSAVKPMDGFFTTFFVSPYSKYIARWAARRGLTPNLVTTVSMAVGMLAAGAFAVGSRAWYVAGAVLLQAAFTLDCVDGQLARYTLQFSRFGAWLDSMFDRGKEYVVYAGLAVGASRAGDPVWLLAGAALTFQTVRHMFDFSFAASEQQAMGEAPHRPLSERWDGVGPPPVAAALAPASPPRQASSSTPLPQRALVSWRRLNRMPGAIWVKRMIPFPIGERFAVISVTAALFTPRTTFVVLLAWGTVAFAYGLGGRLLRSFR
jgi:phosphatidylglycerophosphate synthase